MILPTIPENHEISDLSHINEFSPIWKNLPIELANIIMKEYVFSFDDLEKACLINDISTIQFIYNNSNMDHNKYLLLASMNGYLNIVKYTIKNGATSKVKAYIVASCFGQTHIKQFLKKLID